MTNFSWECPYCSRGATITGSDYSSDTHYFNNGNKDGASALVTTVITCPNENCHEYSIKARLYPAENIGTYGTKTKYQELRQQWLLKPNSLAKQFPAEIVPDAILADYEEACLIRDLSPKASATLSRRCIQGIIRDYWGILKNTLFLEINALKGEIDADTWAAIDAVRKVGNIGAHMEKDIDMIVDVEPAEAQLLIGLIESLIKDWYIARHDRQTHLAAITNMAAAKKEQKNAKKEGK